jgi:hypothetical protein
MGMTKTEIQIVKEAEGGDKKMLVIKSYNSFNERRYGNPWVAKVNADGKINFSVKVGGYTGGYNKGEAGQLYINNPVEGAVYAYGQKDYRGNNGGYSYIKIVNGEIVAIDKTQLVEALNG